MDGANNVKRRAWYESRMAVLVAGAYTRPRFSST